jgi:hypothetical protein
MQKDLSNERRFPSPGVWLRAQFNVPRGSVESTVAGLFALIWQRKGLILTSILFWGFVGYVAALVQTPKYVATMRLIPNVEDQLAAMSESLSGGTGSLGSSLSSLASGGGLLKPEKVTKFQQFAATMTSLPVAAALESKGHYLRHFYPDKWDSEHNRWRTDPTLLESVKGAIKDILGMRNVPHPDAVDLADLISRKVAFDEDDKVSVYTMRFSDEDPEFAKAFLLAVYRATEGELLSHERATTDARVKAAEQALQRTTVESSRQALTHVLVLFDIRALDAAVGSPYAAKILDGPVVSDYKADPSVLRYLLVGAMAGLILSLIVIVSLGLVAATDV